MNRITGKNIRILSIAPSFRGFGFAVMEGPGTLVDWGVKTVKGDKNSRSLAKVEELFTHYQPGVLVLQDNSTQQSRRSARIRQLGEQIVVMASIRNVRAVQFSREQLMRVLLANDQGTKHTVAEMLAKRFPEELGFLLPPKRRPWMSENYRMDIFDAVSLALASCLSKRRTTPKT